MFTNFTVLVQLFFTIIIGMYFFIKLRSETSTGKTDTEQSRREAERLNRMRHISLTKPLTEQTRPKNMGEIVGQEEGIRALKAALCGKNPQHVIIYGPPGVGKTAAARLALEVAKQSKGTPFKSDAPFIEADATIMRYDERSIADPLIGSVHDPIYQGAGEYGNKGIPQPKEGAVSKAHGGVLFVDEIGELHQTQLNRLLKVLEDRCVILESAYYSSENKSIPTYIHDIFQNGIPADFRLIGATTRKPEEIPEAIRSRCVEIYFKQLTREDILKIVKSTSIRMGAAMEAGVGEILARYAKNGRDTVKMLQTAANIVGMEGRYVITKKDIEWVVKAGKYKENTAKTDNQKIVSISLFKPKEKNS